MDVLIHQIISFILSSLVLWQLVLGVYIILIWAKRNIKFNNSPVINVSESKQGFDYPIEVLKDRLEGKKMSNAPIEVDVNRKTIIDTKSDEVSVKLDEKIKGKVKTQKDKLRNLRK